MCVVVDGPFPNADPYGDEYPEWVVQVVYADESEGPLYRYRSYSSAVADGKRIAKEKRCELVMEAMHERC